MREIRTSGSMSGDGKRDQYAPGVQSTRARPRLYPRAGRSEGGLFMRGKGVNGPGLLGFGPWTGRKGTFRPYQTP